MAREVKIGAIILAAGASVRLGQPKQLLVWQGRSLVTRAAEALLAAGVRDVIAVLGAHAEHVRGALDGLAVRVLENTEWREGMASSIRVGVEALTVDSDGVLVALCDQPFFTADVATRLIETWKTNSQKLPSSDDLIVAAHYAGRAAAPAIFGRGYFDALRKLSGDKGARRVIMASNENVVCVDLPELAMDVDTPEDWVAINRMRHHRNRN